MPLYNLLPRVSVGEHSYFPYLSDHEMETLRWMAESYSNELPVYVPDSGRLLKGDRVRITSGSFMGMEAEVVVQPGGGHKDVMVRILDCMWVPLFEVRQGEYELIELNTKGKHVYTHWITIVYRKVCTRRWGVIISRANWERKTNFWFVRC